MNKHLKLNEMILLAAVFFWGKGHLNIATNRFKIRVVKRLQILS